MGESLGLAERNLIGVSDEDPLGLTEVLLDGNVLSRVLGPTLKIELGLLVEPAFGEVVGFKDGLLEFC